MKTITMLAAAVSLGAVVAAPSAHADGTQAGAEQAVQQLYTQVQRGCTPSMAPSFQRIVWDVPFNGEAGSGRIVDANASLGGPFAITWSGSNSPLPSSRVVPAQPSGYWDINLEFC